MKFGKYLLVLILFLPINCDANLVEHTGKVITFFNDALRATLPSESDKFKKFENIKSSSGLNGIIDELRILYSVLLSRSERSQKKTKDMFADGFQKVVPLPLTAAQSVMAMELSFVVNYGVTFDDFAEPFEKMSTNDNVIIIKSLMEKLRSIFTENQQVIEFFKSIKFDNELSQVIVEINFILSNP